MRKRLHRNIISRSYYLGVLLFAILLGLLVQGCSSSNQAKLSVGEKAPDFTLPSATGDTVSLSDYLGRQPVLLYFHMAEG